MQSRFIGLVLAAVLSVPVFAQTAPVKVPPPELTQIEKLQLENIQLKFDKAVQTELAAKTLETTLKSQYQDLVTKFEKENPGFTLDPSGNGAVIPKTEAKSAVKK